MSRNKRYWHKRLALENDETIKEIEEAVLERGSEIVEEKPNDGLVHISEIGDEIKKEYDNWGKMNGLPTGLPSLDDKLKGLGKGHVILVGGETSNGKSALVANIAVNIAKTKPMLFITLEMAREEIGSRIMHINGGTIDGLDMIFQSKHRLSYKDIKPLVKNAMEMGSVKFVVLDYLQYLGRGMTDKEVAIMSKEIKTLALEFNIPFMVVVSLRKSEGGKNKRKWTEIEIEDYMGAGAIGYDCDVGMLASRKDMDDQFDTNSMYVKLLKTRNAPLDYSDRYIKFSWDQTRIYEDWADQARNVGEFAEATEAGTEQVDLINKENA